VTTYRFEFRAVSNLPADFVQQRTPGHPLAGDSPIRAEFDTAEAYVTAWHQWRRMSAAYRREEQFYGDEVKVRIRTWAELRRPDIIPLLEEAGMI